MIAGGVYLLATPGDCYVNVTLMSCSERYPNDIAGALMIELAAPLIAVPIVHAIRAAAGVQVRVTATADGGGAVVRAEGSF